MADEIFAVSAEGMEEIPAKPGPITPLPNQPPHVKGVTFSKGRLLPVIDFSQRMLSQRAAAGRSMLITEIDGAAFGFLIDSDEEMLSINDVSIKTLPHIVQTTWMKHIVIHARALIPMIDVTKALSKGTIDETPAWKRYSPGSEFADQFFKQDVDVVEFSLLGERHALPKVEVEDVIALKSCRTLANESSIVIGVVEHNGEILPVIDIALLFGRHSLATSSWRMILVQNGDFRALIITETVFGDRRLAPATHRKVPIHLPHDLMYGCYPEDKTVRLILNIEAISVHFERSMIKILIPTLSHEMRISPTGTAVGLQNEQMGEVSQSQEIVPHEETMEVIQAKPKLESDFRQEEIAYAPVSSSDIQESQVAEGGWSEWDSDDTIEQYEVEKIVSHEALVSEETIMPEEIAAENSEGVLEDVLANPVQRKQKQEEIAEKVSMTASVLTDRETEPIHAKSEIFLERAPTSLVSNDSKSSGSIYAEVTFLLQGLYRRCHVVFLGLKCKKMYGAIAVVFITAIFFVAISNKSDIEKNVKEAELSATNTESIRTQGEQDKVQNVSGHFAEEPLAMLELKIPENMPVDIDVYVVVKDDTLWSISERFTGDPFNYPRIAGENKIAKPDLIFPGQRIRLIR